MDKLDLIYDIVQGTKSDVQDLIARVARLEERSSVRTRITVAVIAALTTLGAVIWKVV